MTLQYCALFFIAALAFTGGGLTVQADENAAQPCTVATEASCPDGTFCEVAAGHCDDTNLEGQCSPRPELCTMDYNPVCGCDERTHANDCGRRGAGIRKDHDGECAGAGE